MKKIILPIVLLSIVLIANAQSLTLVSPANNFRFNATASRLFVWNPPTGIATTSGITYTLKIVELPSVTTITASDFTTTTGFYTKTIGGISLITTSSHIVPTPFNIEKYYAWNIKAVVETSNQTIFTQSDIQYFKGRLSVEVFNAGFYNVFMQEIYNSDLTTFSGKGICPTGLGSTKSVTFSGLYITNEGGIFVLNSGAITHTYPNDTILPLIDNAGKSSADAVYSQFRLDKDALTTSRVIKLNTKLKNIRNQDLILSSNNTTSSTVPLKTSLDTLSNIYNIKLRITGSGGSGNDITQMYISGNSYDCYHFGSFVLPVEKYGNSDFLNFSSNTIINYIAPQNISPVAKINVPSISGLSFSSDSVFIDLTTTVSPPIYASNPSWEGIVFRNSSLSYTTTIAGLNIPLSIPFPGSIKRVATIDKDANLDLITTFTGTLTNSISVNLRSSNININYFDFDRSNPNSQKSILKGKFKYTSFSLRNLGEFDLIIDEKDVNNPKITVQNSSVTGSLAKSYIYDFNSNQNQPFKLYISNNDVQSSLKIQASKNTNEPYIDLVYTLIGNNQYQIISDIQPNTLYNFRVVTTYDNGTKKDTSFAVPINTGVFLQVGITESIISHSHLKTYPNPFIDEIKVLDFDANTVYNIELINSSGSVLALNNYFSNAGTLVLNTQNISAGLYTLKITTSKGVFVSKVIK